MRAIALAALLTVACAVGAAQADPFSDLTQGGNDACFRRDYDAAHLRVHPRQQIAAMSLWLKGETKEPGGNIGLAIVRRSDLQALFLSGGCDWEVYKDGKSWMKSFKKKAGAGCITLAVPDVFPDASSAEEGGGVLLDPVADGKSVTVHLDDIQTMVKRANRGRKITVRLGAEDRVFLLRRTDVKDCEFVKEALTTRAHDPAK
jgi:hypothetical protein